MSGLYPVQSIAYLDRSIHQLMYRVIVRSDLQVAGRLQLPPMVRLLFCVHGYGRICHIVILHHFGHASYYPLHIHAL